MQKISDILKNVVKERKIEKNATSAWILDRAKKIIEKVMGKKIAQKIHPYSFRDGVLYVSLKNSESSSIQQEFVLRKSIILELLLDDIKEYNPFFLKLKKIQFVSVRKI